MIYSWKNKIVTYGNSDSDLVVSAGTTYTIPADTISYWNNATISGTLYVHRTSDFRVKGTLTIASGGVIQATQLLSTESAGTTYASASTFDPSTPDATISSTYNGSDGSSVKGANAIKIMAKKLVNNGTIASNGFKSSSPAGTGSGGGFIWIITEDMSGIGQTVSYAGAGADKIDSSPYNCRYEDRPGCYSSDNYCSNLSKSMNTNQSTKYALGCSYTTAYNAGSSGTQGSICVHTKSTPTGGTTSNPAQSVSTTNWAILPLGSILWFNTINLYS